MTILGIQTTTNTSGETNTTLHVMEPFDPYYMKPEAGRNCTGKKVETVYVGGYDCSNLKPGVEIEVYYDRAVSTSKGTFQSVKKIEIITKKGE